MGRSLALFNLPLVYLLWHYSAAWADLWRLCTNFSWFLFNFFSIKILFGTLFAPWKRLHEAGKGRGTGGIAGRFILNFITRLVGFLVRTVTILFGLSSLVLLFLFFLAVFALWVVLPLVALGLILNGVVGLFIS